jgi:hypothetical protein
MSSAEIRVTCPSLAGRPLGHRYEAVCDVVETPSRELTLDEAKDSK